MHAITFCFSDPQNSSDGAYIGILTGGVAGILIVLLIFIIGFRMIIHRRSQQAILTQPPHAGDLGDYQPNNINSGILFTLGRMVGLTYLYGLP